MSTISIDDVTMITVLGAGNMGHGIAEVAALSGYQVNLRDIEQEYVENGYERIEWSVKKFTEAGKLTDEKGQATLDRIDIYVDLETALADVDVVIEVVPEKMDLKKEVYAEIGKYAPDHAVFATNTSTLSITELSAATDRPEQFCGTHFFNPPIQMPLVEVICGEHTSDEALDFAEDLVESFDKTPVRVRKDVPGFIVNRVLVPMLNEAAWIVEMDDARIAEVDSTATERLGLPMGCFELLDQIGIDVAVDVLEYMYETLGEGYAPCLLLREKVEAGAFGKKTDKGFYDWEDGGGDIPPDAGRDSVEHRLVGVAVNEMSKLVVGDVTDSAAIDEAMNLGAGFPDGPTELADAIGYDQLHETLARLYDETDEPRYEPTTLLGEWAESGGPDE